MTASGDRKKSGSDGTRRKPARKKSTAGAGVRKRATQNTPDAPERERMIAETAYFIAEQRGFVGGDPTADWLAAEAEVERRLKGKQPRRRRISAGADATTDNDISAALHAGLEKASKQLEQWRKRAARLTSDARSELEREVTRLSQLRDTVEHATERLKHRTEARSAELRTRAEHAWEELKTGLEKLSQRGRR